MKGLIKINGISTNGLPAIILLACLYLFSCSKKADVTILPPANPPVIPPPTGSLPSLATVRSWLVDKNATEQTAALFYNFKKLAKTKILFGHQDDTKRGVTNANIQWANEQHLPAVSTEKSDVKDITGAYPAVYGHDLQHIADFLSGAWFDYEKVIAKQLTIEAYNRGGINTYSWHYDNPVAQTDGSFYWANAPVEAVSKILPGGSHHEVFKGSLREVADFARSLVGADGKLVPVVFRPFHEFDGGWFWWGASHCTAEQYKQLYQFTVSYLRDVQGIRNFLYAWSPDKNFTTLSQYLERYPGDAYVDVVGADNYGDLSDASNPSTAANKYKIVSDYSKANNKVAAMTETGSSSNLTRADWYTAILLPVLKSQPLELAYTLVWANTRDNFYTPYRSHAAEADFINFKADPYLIFGDRLPAMYQIN